MPLTPAEQLLQELGVTEPGEIDLEAIAYHIGVRVRLRPLDRCEAHIVGIGDSAIVTINSNSSSRRRRFSIAHELGHWHHHRGKSLACRIEDYKPQAIYSPERIADTYAANLLMPGYLFRPRVRGFSKVTLKAVTALAEIFDTSRTACAIRLVEGDYVPGLLICHQTSGRKWFTRAPSVPEKWFPRDDLDAASFAFGVLYGKQPEDPIPRRIGADAWFDRREADRFDVQEQTMRVTPSEVVTLVILSDKEMLED